MLKYYFASVVIWWVVIYALSFILKPKVTENGWLEEVDELENDTLDYILGVFAAFAIAAVPIFRMIFTMYVLIFASMTPEEFEDWYWRR